ncbi:conserved hypothetical protein [Leishmania mexicana MHOM/GT/2001/U1103]|uniref:Centrosomal protein POC5 n=1 Tax=Leishmania mexicana (strain MHOM/GT/2001/U1103) TaxID=929439 RepID=E9AT47_LEIMU|nr:conserved hypothetical protein [Leishmania mexicana MHOM/GT/2001/U1103]CBZ26121.1 conserved hypothetical protein [Leishmania mexicana MHOM/GT/2001/U1103]
MPLVKAETDESFVAEVAENVGGACARMNDHISIMIEEYLRRRTQQVRDDAKQELDAVCKQLERRIADAEAAKAAEEARHHKKKAQVMQAAVELQQMHANLHLERLFHIWRRCADVRRERRRLAEEAHVYIGRLSLFHAYMQWRLFAAALRQKRLEAKEAHKRDCREQELLGQIEGYQRQLEEERAKDASLNEKLKEAFLRGMCALNREAVHVLHGSEENQDADVEAIAEILSRESHSRHRSVTPGHMDSSTPSNLHAHGVCPVHHIDAKGNFYHPCFSPGHCEYDRHSGSRAPVSAAVPPSASGPFVVRADPKSARSIDSSPPVPFRHLSKSSKTQWRM